VGAVRVTVHIPASVPADAFEACRDLFEDFCTVTASVRRGIDVEVAIDRGEPERYAAIDAPDETH
jgi:hypothetical protein